MFKLPFMTILRKAAKSALCEFMHGAAKVWLHHFQSGTDRQIAYYMTFK